MDFDIYRTIYDFRGTKSFAVCSAESDKEAVSVLEKALVEDKGYSLYQVKPLNVNITKTDFKSSKKGLIFGYDEFSHSFF